MHWKCGICNLIHDGDSPPDVCPKCGSAGREYAQLSEDQWALVERSRLTNGLYMRLLALIPEIDELARQGVADNLDPRCAVLHQRILDDSAFWRKSIMAEINGHVSKGKWG